MVLDTGLIDKYIAETFLNDPDNNKYKQKIYNIINKFFNTTEVDYDELDRQKMIDSFSQMAIMRMNAFQSTKSHINDFMKWMYETGNGTIKPLEEIREIYFEDVNRDHFYDAYYFSDLDDLNDLMETVFGKEECDFSTVRCAIFLVWHGMVVKNLPEILKKDLLDNGVVTDPITKEVFKISPKVFPYIRRYRDADNFDSGKFGGTTVPFAQTQYLFRTYKTAHMTAKQLINTTSNANKAAKETGRVFRWNCIYDSGIFYRTYQYEQENGKLNRNDYDMLRTLFRMEHIDLSNKRQCYYLSQKYDEYQEFKRYKYGD